MLGKDEISIEFPNCRCNNFIYWWGTFLLPRGFKAKVFFNPKSILAHTRAKQSVVTYMSKTSWRVPIKDELSILEDVRCIKCGCKATEEQINLIKEVAYLEIECSRRITP